jgi:hypothetical protein
MRTHTRLILGALTAVLVFAAAVDTASANRLSVSSNTFRATWRPLTFSTGAEAEGITVACNVTLEGSFHYNTMTKVRNALIGYIAKAAATHPCSGSGEAWYANGVESNELGTFRNTLPWHVTYQGFEGTLPTMSELVIIHKLLIITRTIGVLCEYNGFAEGSLKLQRTGVATSILPNPLSSIPKTSGGILCPSRGFFSANAENSAATALGTATLITVRLI